MHFNYIYMDTSYEMYNLVSSNCIVAYTAPLELLRSASSL
jgi:hypothetical protein